MIATQKRLAKPFLKYAGGKTRLAPEIIRHYLHAQRAIGLQMYGDPEYRFDAYFQPFLGGGQPFWEMANQDILPFEVFLSDVDYDLIAAYIMVKAELPNLFPILWNMERDYRRLPESFHYSLRETDPRPLTDLERAARFIVLNHTGFNGLNRKNASGKNNVPWCKNPNVYIFDDENLVACAEALCTVTIQLQSYDQARDQWRVFASSQRKYHTPQHAYMYLDPPYIPLKAGGFTAYGPGGFGIPQQIDLMWFCHQLKEEGITWLQTNSDSPVTRALYQHQTYRPVQMPRSINSNVNSRGAVSELIITG